MSRVLAAYIEKIRNTYQQYCNGVPINLPPEKVEQFKKRFDFINNQHWLPSRGEIVAYLKNLENDFKPGTSRARRLYHQRRIEIMSGRTGPYVLKPLTDKDAKIIRTWIVRELKKLNAESSQQKIRERTSPKEKEFWRLYHQHNIKSKKIDVVKGAMEDMGFNIVRSTVAKYLKNKK